MCPSSCRIVGPWYAEDSPPGRVVIGGVDHHPAADELRRVVRRGERTGHGGELVLTVAERDVGLRLVRPRDHDRRPPLPVERRKERRTVVLRDLLRRPVEDERDARIDRHPADRLLHVLQRPGRRLPDVDDVVDRFARVPSDRLAADHGEEPIFVRRTLRTGEVGDHTADQAERTEDRDRRDDRDDRSHAATAAWRADRGRQRCPREVRTPRHLVIGATGWREGSGVHPVHGRRGIGERRASLDPRQRTRRRRSSGQYTNTTLALS